MNKYVKYTLYAIVSIMVLIFSIILIAGLVIPKQQIISCSKSIDAPASLIYQNISDYKQWQKWDPWAEVDPQQKRTMNGMPGTVGHNYAWSGNDQVGEGSMAITALEKDKSIDMELTFIKPWESIAQVNYSIEEKNGQSLVTWNMRTDYPLYYRLMSKFMEGMLKKDFDKGLAKLKTLCEKQANEMSASNASSKSYDIKETMLSARNYVILKKTNASVATLGDFFMKEMPNIGKYVQSSKMESDGFPSALYYKYDAAKGVTDLAIAIPVKKISTVAAPYESYVMNATKAVTVDYYGPYEEMELTYSTMYAYMASANLTQNGPAIEEYIGDPVALNGDMSKCLTRINIPVK